MRILAIDPGSTQSAWLEFDSRSRQIGAFGLEPNAVLLEGLRDADVAGADLVVIEWTAPRGMPASAELFETMFWAGRFAEAARPTPVDRINRLEVKRRLCGRTSSTDANVRAALIDLFGGVGGASTAIGRKASPGPLYGITKDVWAALAVAVTYGPEGEVLR